MTAERADGILRNPQVAWTLAMIGAIVAVAVIASAIHERRTEPDRSGVIERPRLAQEDPAPAAHGSVEKSTPTIAQNPQAVRDMLSQWLIQENASDPTHPVKLNAFGFDAADGSYDIVLDLDYDPLWIEDVESWASTVSSIVAYQGRPNRAYVAVCSIFAPEELGDRVETMRASYYNFLTDPSHPVMADPDQGPVTIPYCHAYCDVSMDAPVLTHGAGTRLLSRKKPEPAASFESMLASGVIAKYRVERAEVWVQPALWGGLNRDEKAGLIAGWAKLMEQANGFRDCTVRSYRDDAVLGRITWTGEVKIER